LQNVPKPNPESGRRACEAFARRRGKRHQCISFRVGRSLFALGIREIQEILKSERVQESAFAVHDCIGLLDVRGTTVPVIDFAALLGTREADRGSEATAGDRRIVDARAMYAKSAAPSAGAKVLVFKRDRVHFGFVVDGVNFILSVAPQKKIRLPGFLQETSEGGCRKTSPKSSR